jgi:hypothetical protein
MKDQRPAWPILTEAGVAVLAASIAIRLFPFKRLASHLAAISPNLPSASQQQVDDLARSIRAWAVRLPWRTLCFEQGLAAYWMLRRRRLAATLFYGAASLDGEFKAHVWVRSGDRAVVGCENASDYALLAQFPGVLS